MVDWLHIDFSRPKGEPALVPPDSVSWRVFKNPVALYVGGITAVLLELAEPRVRSGVWNHSSFRSRPLRRLRRTGQAALVTVYGPRSAAERLISEVTRLHARVRGKLPNGVSYRALDPELLCWVQATAGYGFLQAYHRLVQPLPREAHDDFYAEAAPAARLYGAADVPRDASELEARFAATLPRLEHSPVIFEFLEIMQRTPKLPRGLAALRAAAVRVAIEQLPRPVRELLGLGERFDPGPWQRRAVRAAAAAAERLTLPSAPPARACERLGLPARHLYRQR